jgi:UDP-N-acetylglucosamine transferase subunit ALG13
MIFASVGSMLPFDRFVKAVDEWARDNPSEDVFIQIGAGEYEPVHAPFARIVPLSEYRQRLQDCDLFVAHVGMGSILQALEARKQMLLLPRDYSLGEHTTDHQVHTARRFQGREDLKIVETIADLKAEMTRLLREPLAIGGNDFSTKASPQLLAAVSNFLNGVAPIPSTKPE